MNKKPSIAISIFILVLVNIVPIFGVLLLGWSPFEIIFIYWVETGIIGFINLFKMAVASKDSPLLLKFIMIPFFTVHFGLFTGIQGIIILFVMPLGLGGSEFGALDLNSLLDIFKGLYLPSILLLGSHVFSFFWNFLGKKEYQQISIGGLMFQPYGRIVAQQFIAIFGIGIAVASSNSLIIVILVILAKIISDIFAHRREHRKLQKAALQEEEATANYEV